MWYCPGCRKKFHKGENSNGLVGRGIKRQVSTSATTSDLKDKPSQGSNKPPAAAAAKTEGPPAPKRPFGRPSISLVETTPILPQLKHEPYVFIAHCYVPVLSTTISHLKKRLKMYSWTDVRCDETGYFITFENSKRGEIEAKRVYDGCHMNAFFTYVMNMELQQYGNPNIERSPTPDKIQPRPVPVVVPRVDNKD